MVIAGIFRLIGVLESVDPSPSVALSPSAVAAARPLRTIGEFSGVDPAGRSPTSSLTTVIVTLPPQR
jgi:hypothetical protein